MPTDKQNVEFLYAIIKQLEVKHINWRFIAETCTIPNGHAARMRFHRLKQNMEGQVPKPRTVKEDPDSKFNKPNHKRKAKDIAAEKLRKKIADLEGSEDDEEPLADMARKRMRIKQEEDDGSGDDYVDENEIKTELKEEPWIKEEDVDMQPAETVQEAPASEQAHVDTDQAIAQQPTIKEEEMVDSGEDLAGIVPFIKDEPMI